MYKGASQHLQRKRGRSFTFRFKGLVPKSRFDYRVWWLPLIVHARNKGIKPKSLSSVPFPDWLHAETQRLGDDRWLELWLQRFAESDSPKAKLVAAKYRGSFRK